MTESVGYGHFFVYSILLAVLAYTIKLNADLSSKILELHMECIPSVAREGYKVKYQEGMSPKMDEKLEDGSYIPGKETLHNELMEPGESTVPQKVSTKIDSSESSEYTDGISEDFKSTHARSSVQSIKTEHLEYEVKEQVEASQESELHSDILAGEMDYLQMDVFGTEFRSDQEEITQNDVKVISSEINSELYENDEIFEDAYDEDSESGNSVHGVFNAFSDDTLPSTQELKESDEFYSSVICQGHPKFSRICHFRNLCYSAFDDAFVFFHGNRSIYHHSQFDEEHVSLVHLSTVYDFNGHGLLVIDRQNSNFDPLSANFVNETSILFYRFKPDNLLHVIHDDILPLHHTLEFLGVPKDKISGKYTSHLVLMEGWDAVDFINLYQSFSFHPIVSATSLRKMPYTCFEKIYTGLSKETVWYHYGYNMPQGPVPNICITTSQVQQTVRYLVNQLQIPKEANVFMTDSIILLSRKQNRRILNEMEIMLQISMKLRKKVTVLSFETHSLTDMIHYAQHANGLIGMHGSLLSLAMFLPPRAFVIELFPYAINPRKYTPYKNLVELPGSGVVYRSWVNTNITNTKGHMNWPKEFGGIGHLSSEKQKEILAQQEVPDHLCCEDASWLYHAYQDTHVNISELYDVIKSALHELSKRKIMQAETMFPSPVRNVVCTDLSPLHDLSSTKRTEFELSWQPPVNKEDLVYTIIMYEIFVDSDNVGELSRTYKTNQTKYKIAHDSQVQVLKIWIRAVLDSKKFGQAIYKECKTV